MVPRAAVYAPDGAQVSGTFTGSEQVQLPATAGTYTVFVSDSNFTKTGNYDVTISGCP